MTQKQSNIHPIKMANSPPSKMNPQRKLYGVNLLSEVRYVRHATRAKWTWIQTANF